MIRRKAHNIYASSLYNYVKSLNQEMQVFEDLNIIYDVLKKSTRALDVISSPAINIELKKGIIESIVENLSTRDIMLKFFMLLIENKKISYILELIEEYNYIYKENINIKDAVIKIAYEMSEKELNKIENSLSEKFNIKFNFTKQIDPSILGGIVVEFDNYRLDASARQRLKNLEEKAGKIIALL